MRPTKCQRQTSNVWNKNDLTQISPDSMAKNVQRKENNIVHIKQDNPTQIRTQ